MSNKQKPKKPWLRIPRRPNVLDDARREAAEKAAAEAEADGE